MARYISQRVAMQFATLIASTIIIFLLLHLAPGNPATLLNGGHPPSPATIKYFNRLYGFNRPLPIQYWVWLHHLLEGNLGESAADRVSVLSVIAPRIGSHPLPHDLRGGDHGRHRCAARNRQRGLSQRADRLPRQRGSH